jgi:hypothetical protein
MSEQDNSQLNDALGAAAKNSALGKVAAAEEFNGKAVIASIGGVRGLVESILPSFVFLVVFLITKDVVLSALIPLAVAVAFIVVRAVTKLQVTPAITGAVGVAITAILAISTNRAENNFILGIWLNVGYLVAFVISIVVRRPLIGVIVGFLLGEQAAHWREAKRERRMLTLLTWLWAGMFALRLVVEVPLYLAANAAGLGVAKLILGVPLYAVVLWITWLLVRSVFPPKPAAETSGTETAGESLEN